MSDLLILAAGSTRHLIPSLLEQYNINTSEKFLCHYGPSGLLKSRIETGIKFSIFVSASAAHTESLGLSGNLRRNEIFGYNRLVLLHRCNEKIFQDNVLNLFSDQSLSLGLSTTGLNQTIELMEILNEVSSLAGVNPGDLKARTRIITGGRERPNAPSDRNQYGWIMETKSIDLMLTVQSNAVEAVKDNPELTFAQLPLSIKNVGPYGLGLAKSGAYEAEKLYDWLLNNDKAREILIERGFSF